MRGVNGALDRLVTPIVAKSGPGVSLGMHRMNRKYVEPDSLAPDVLLREEPEEEEEEDEEEDGGDNEQDDDGDEGYSE